MDITIDKLNFATVEQDMELLDQMETDELREMALDYGVDPTSEKSVLVVEIARAMHGLE